MEKIQMDTLVNCMKYLDKEGYITQFKATENGLLSLSTQTTYKPTETKIVHFFRFEGESNPSDNAIAYAIETHRGEKGTLIDSYGTTNDEWVTAFVKQITDIQK